MKTRLAPATESVCWTLVCALVLGAEAEFSHGGFFSDFPAFFCGGKLTLAGISPYLLAPLDACERAVHLGTFVTPPRPGEPIPLPYPGYVLVFLALFALLPPATALGAWISLALLALGLGLTLLRRGVPHLSAASAFLIAGLPAVSGIIALGHPTTILAASLCGAIVLVRAGRDRGALAALVPGLIAPQIGLLSMLGLAWARPRTRLPAALVLAALSAVSLAAGGPAATLRYLRGVLPDHALVSILHAWQYALGSALFAFGASAETAVATGRMGSLVGIALGLAIAMRARDEEAATRAIVLPAALASILGSFANAEHFAALVPALVLCTQRAAVPVLLAAVAATWCPWSATGSVVSLIGLPALAYVALRARTPRTAAATAATLLGASAIYLGRIGFVWTGEHAPLLALDPLLAQSGWYREVAREIFVRSSPAFTWIKLPTWIGMVAAILFAARPHPPKPGTRPS